MDKISDKGPLASEDAERAVIGSILIDARRVIDLCINYGVTPATFYTRKYALMYAAIERLHRGGAFIDVLSVAEGLANGGMIEQVGGSTALDDCVDKTPTSAHAEYYIELIRKKEKLREIINASRLAEEACTSGHDVNPEEIASSYAAKMLAVSGGNDAVKSFTDIKQEFMREWTGEADNVIPSRWGILNNVIVGYQKQDYIVVAARPSDGKTTMMLNEACHFALDCGVPVGIFTPDTTRKKLLARMACHLAGVNYIRLATRQADSEEINRVTSQLDILEKAPIYIDDRTPTISQLVTRATSMKQKYNIGVVVLDYIQQLRMTGHERSGSRTETVGAWSGTLKSLFKDIDVTGLVLSQLNRGGDRFQTSTPPPPTLEALRDSGTIEQDADVVVFLYKKPNQSISGLFVLDRDWPMEWSVAKNKDGPTGPFPMMFQRKYYTYMSEAEYAIQQGGYGEG